MIQKEEKQYPKLFQDVIELVQFTKFGLSKEYELSTLTTLYDNYRLLIKAYNSGNSLLKGHFKNDIGLEIYQQTTSFISPKDKWVYFSKEQLKVFNHNLLDFIRSFTWIKFPTESYEYRFLDDNLGRFSAFMPNKENDIKLEFNFDCSIISYSYFNFGTKKSDFSFEKQFTQKISYDSSVLVENLTLLLLEIEKYKTFLDDYFEKNLTPKKLQLDFEKNLLKLDFKLAKKME